MKYKVQRAILDEENSKQAQDTTVSTDGMKMRLSIAHDDNAKWLFERVENFHGKKITWRQIREYLRETLKIREKIRVSFKNQSKEEMINYISKTVEENESRNQTVLKELESNNKDMEKVHIESTRLIRKEVDYNYKLLKNYQRQISRLERKTEDINELLKAKEPQEIKHQDETVSDNSNQQILQMLGTIMDQMNRLTEDNKYLRQRIDNMSQNEQTNVNEAGDIQNRLMQEIEVQENQQGDEDGIGDVPQPQIQEIEAKENNQDDMNPDQQEDGANIDVNGNIDVNANENGNVDDQNNEHQQENINEEDEEDQEEQKEEEEEPNENEGD